MKSDNPTLEKYAELMIEKIKEVNASGWQKPWFTSKFKEAPKNLMGRPYSNINKTILYLICDKYKFQTPVFVTFNQARNDDFQILKGSKSIPVTFYDLYIKDEVTGEKISRNEYNILSPKEQERYKVTPIQKHYNVFNLDQTNYAEQYPEKWEQLKDSFKVPIAETDGYCNKVIDKVIDNQTWYCPITLENQDRAFYSIASDSIKLPTKEQFPGGREFYYTALHEMAHSTMHATRLNRKGGYFGTPKYAHEELIAEFSSAVTGRDMGLAVLPRTENAQYLKSWLSAISDDPKYIMNILNDVNKAVTMIEEGIGLNKVQEIVIEQKQTDIPVMTEDEYLASKGYRDPFYSEPATHKGKQKTSQQQDQLLNFHIGRSNKYTAERNTVKIEYQTMLDRGEVRQPTKTERIIKAANGHIDLESTQAARRVALANGINWQPARSNLPAICQYYFDKQHQLHAKFYQEGDMYDRFVWENGNNYILCTGSRSGGDYVEHVLPPEEILQIRKLNQIELQSSGCRTLIGKIGEANQINSYHILDNSTGKTEALRVGDIDLSKQSPEVIKKLLSCKQVEIKDKFGENCLANIQKSPSGWKLMNEKQLFKSEDFTRSI